MSFTHIPLNPKLLSALAKKGFEVPTPVQAQAIPPALEGKDVLASAQTGTGKTAAFVLPSLHRILAGPSAVKGRGPRVVVLTPTRELAQQVLDNVRVFGSEASIKTGVIYGGVSYNPQYALLQNSLDLMVATPGRLIDHMNEGRVDFSRVETLVLDEADKMLDMGFLKPVERIMQAINNAAPRPQVLLFSATFTKAVDQFATRVLKAPVRISLAPAKVSHAQITQKAYRADSQEHKFAMLENLLDATKGEQVLVFSATKFGAEKLAKRISHSGYEAAALHGGMQQNARKRTLAAMHGGQVQVLVATDVAARGIDVKQLGHVINYDLPQVAEDYVHRIGRTGRAGESGVAVSLVSPQDYPMMKDIEKVLGKPMGLAAMDGHTPELTMDEFTKLGAAAPKSRQKPKVHGAPRGHAPSQGQRPAREGNEGGYGKRIGGGYQNRSQTESSARKGFRKPFRGQR